MGLADIGFLWTLGRIYSVGVFILLVYCNCNKDMASLVSLLLWELWFL